MSAWSRCLQLEPARIESKLTQTTFDYFKAKYEAWSKFHRGSPWHWLPVPGQVIISGCGRGDPSAAWMTAALRRRASRWEDCTTCGHTGAHTAENCGAASQIQKKIPPRGARGDDTKLNRPCSRQSEARVEARPPETIRIQSSGPTETHDPTDLLQRLPSEAL